MKIFRYFYILFVLCLALLIPIRVLASAIRTTSSQTNVDGQQPVLSQDIPTDQIIVKYKNPEIFNNLSQPAQDMEMQRLSDAAGVTLVFERLMSGEAQVLRLAERLPTEQVRLITQGLMTLPEVEYAEPDAIMQHTLIPNDPQYSNQWHYFAPSAGNYGINAPAAWNITTGSASIVAAVIDTGITNHADLNGRTVPGYDFINDSLVANDGDGRDSNPSDPGDWITAAENASGYFQGCQITNSSWHGTHTAGTIGAASNNSLGVAGVNWNSKILPVRVLGKCGGYESDIVDGMRWAAGLSVSGVPNNANPAKVINLSLGGSGTCSTTYQNAINAITAAGTTVVVAAGNSNANASGFKPANCNGVITVAATNRNGSRAFYSNYGATVEISAPGGDTSSANSNGILSTLNTGTQGPVGDTYVYYQGTSMAAPHVAGVVSLLYSLNPQLTPAQVLQILQNTVTNFPGGSTCNTTICGSGIVNAGSALQSISAPAPFSKSSPLNGATGVSTSPILNWGSSTWATSYEYCYDNSNNDNCDASWVSTGSNTSIGLSGLSNSTTYYWHVRAINTSGTTYSDSNTWWSFTTQASSPPSAFNKTSPSNGATGVVTNPALSWGASSGAASYEYCYDTTNDNACGGSLASTGSNNSGGQSGMSTGQSVGYIPGMQSITGRFNITWGDSQSGQSQTLFTLTTTNGQTIPLQFEDPLPRSIEELIALRGQVVSVEGIWLEAGQPEEGLHTYQIYPPSAGFPEMHSVTGSQPWVSLLCKFNDIATEPKTPFYFQDMYRSTYPGMNHYWREQSFDLMNVLGSDATNVWYTLPNPRSYYVYDNNSDGNVEFDFTRATNDCTAVADAEIYFPNFVGINMMFNSDLDGYAWGGGYYITLDGVSKAWHATWEPPWGYQDITVIAHEMGHGFGMPHSSGEYGQTYDNRWDVLSDSWTDCGRLTDATFGCLGQHTISYHKDLEGWLGSQQVDVPLSGQATVTLEQLALPQTSNPMIVRVPINGSNSLYYTVEVRRNVSTGYDIKLPGSAVIIHEVNTGRENPANVIDIDGNGDTGDAGAQWLPGEVFMDSANNISIAVNSATATGFVVTICNACSGSGSGIWTSTGSNTSVQLSGLSAGTTYYWHVRAINGSGTTYADSNTWWSFTVQSSVQYMVFLPAILNIQPQTPPAAPTNLNAAATSSSAIHLTWNDNASNENGYYVERSPDGSTWSPLITLPANSNSHDDTGLQASTPYYYRVRAYNGAGPSAYSNTASATTQPPGPSLCNGNFEQGGTCWSEFSTHGWQIIINSGFPGGLTPHSGSWAAWLGGDYDDISYIQQQVSVPAGSYYLAYYHWIASEDACGYDFGKVLVNGTAVDVYDLCSSNDTGGWVKHVVNLSAYAGQSVTLQIRVETDYSLNSNLFVDDVAFQSSASASGSATPQQVNPDQALPRSGIDNKR